MIRKLVVEFRQLAVSNNVDPIDCMFGKVKPEKSAAPSKDMIRGSPLTLGFASRWWSDTARERFRATNDAIRESKSKVER